MAILFLFLSILEDCGYMVRIAFVMDRVFRHFGLSGKSFIPLLISSGCGIPGIMASKTIEQDNDRRLTIMTATFIPCGAKLPVIAMMGGVMTSYATGSYEAGGLMAPCMYFIGIVAVLVAAIILKKTKPFSGKPAPFVMELPQYHIPSAKTVLLHVWEKCRRCYSTGTQLDRASTDVSFMDLWLLAK
jgi:ferrous iron transport protein B